MLVKRKKSQVYINIIHVYNSIIILSGKGRQCVPAMDSMGEGDTKEARKLYVPCDICHVTVTRPHLIGGKKKTVKLTIKTCARLLCVRVCVRVSRVRSCLARDVRTRARVYRVIFFSYHNPATLADDFIKYKIVINITVYSCFL